MWNKDYGRVAIIDAPTRTQVIFRVLQRKEGWYEPGEYYKPVKRVLLNSDGSRTIYWKTHKRDEYGVKDVCHINDLKPIEA